MRILSPARSFYAVLVLISSTFAASVSQASAVSQPACTISDHCYAVGFIGSKQQPLWMNGVGSDLTVGCLHVDNRDAEFANWEQWLLTNLNNPKLDTWVEAGMTAGTLYSSPGREKGFLWCWADQRPGVPYREFYIKSAHELASENVTFRWVPGSPNWEIRQNGNLVGISEGNGAFGGQADNVLEVTVPSARVFANSSKFQYQDTGNQWHPAQAELVNDRPDLFLMYTNGQNITGATRKPCVDKTEKMSAESNVTPPTSADLLGVAKRLAAANGESSPADIRYVKTDRNALKYIDGTQPKANDPVYLIQMTGNFVGYAAKIPRGSNAPRGNVLTVTVDAKSGHMLGWSILVEPHDLATFGVVSALR
ncbi:hypothetical protein [Amycolatopsis dendrobii]|uniref:Uncharacterized protein n=1 Tax=Amycolatopsis dendrobii TaxID=2760662 RepID=A0A7W3W5V0_9PSEU|nr:hypothetical protein [Amycolatopsis dendrobii]MBB1159398.1 hypothetical protein [Amycolatopsis dendrobii]